MSKLVDFFVNGGTDHKGRTLEDMINLSDAQLEATHDCIQWMFPLHEKSFHSLHDEILTEEDIDIIKKSSRANYNMVKLQDRICKFFGIWDHDDIRKHVRWCHRGNHNLLRITRIIRSLRLLGYGKYAKYFYYYVSKIAKSQGSKFPSETLEYWQDALHGELMSSMTKRFLESHRIDIE